MLAVLGPTMFMCNVSLLVIVISLLPSKLTPFIFLAVAKAVAVAALPEVSAALLGMSPDTISPLIVADDLFSTLAKSTSDLVVFEFSSVDMLFRPVPPLPTGKIPVTSSVKSTPPDFMLIAPDDAAKLSELKLAIPLLLSVASSAEYVT